MPPVFYEEVRCKRLLLRLSAPHLPFRWAANPYRGCRHPCSYCYARGSHQYRGHQGGADMEQRVVVKVNAAAVLRAEVSQPDWGGEVIALGGACDPYQPAELKYRVTQGMLSVALELGQPCWLSTRSTLVLRDLDLLAALARHGLAQVNVRLCSLKEPVWRHVEPEAAPPAKRLAALERLAQAGVPAGVLLAPILPDLTDDPAALEELVRLAAEHGAAFLESNILALKPGSREWALPLLREQCPHLVRQYVRLYRGPFDPATYGQSVLELAGELRCKYGLPERPALAPAPRRMGQLRLGL